MSGMRRRFTNCGGLKGASEAPASIEEYLWRRIGILQRLQENGLAHRWRMGVAMPLLDEIAATFQATE